MVNNGTMSYDHDRDGTLTQLAGCEAKFRNVDYETHISIKYLNEKLTVLTDLENKHEWKVCFESPNVRLPTGYYFGASATTGDLSDNHDIISFKFYELDPVPDVRIKIFDNLFLPTSFSLPLSILVIISIEIFRTFFTGCYFGGAKKYYTIS